MHTNITRRSFLKKSSLVIAATTLSGGMNLLNASPVAAGANTPFKPHAFVEIAADDTVTVWLGQTNLGQGTHTGIAMIVADELDADWKKVRAKMALAGDAFKNPHWNMQITGGSTSIRHRWDIIRNAGAAARQMLVEAAAVQWGIDKEKCKTSDGKVFHPDGRNLRYGQLVETARKRPVPEKPALKPSDAYRIIGTQRDRLDIPDKVMGKTVFGMDFSVPGMVTALVARPPRYGAVPRAFDTAAAMAVKGVVKVVPLQDRIAVCADTTYAAMQGRAALNIQWSEGSHPDLDDASLDRLLQEQLKMQGAVAKNKGDADAALTKASIVKTAGYKLPFLSHAQVEPMNCTAHVEADRCRLWAPTQGQTPAILTAAAITGLPHEKIEVMTLPAGGGFGIRIEVDPVVDALLLSKALARPVKVIRSREDDFAGDYFRPASHCRITAGLDKQGRLTAWSQKVASQSIMSRLAPQSVKDGIDRNAVEGIEDMPYTVPNHRVDYVMVELPVPVGFWRSVGYSINVFTVETFMDELAHAAGKDPARFRLDHMEKGSRPYRTLSLLVEKSGWHTPVPRGRARGIAVSTCFGSSAAHMAEISVGRDGSITVHKVVCAIDCGPAVYPDAIRAQAEGGVIMGLSTALYEQSNFANGGVKTANYDEYPVLTMSEVPDIEVHIADSRHAIGGIGEPVYPTVAPAVANAVFNATGVRFREMPFNIDLLRKG